MNQPHDPNLTAPIPASSASSDSLGPGLAAAFGQATEAPRSSFGGGLKPVVLPDAAGESSHIVKTQSDELPKAAQAGDRYQLSGEIARGGMGAVLRGRDVDLGRSRFPAQKVKHPAGKGNQTVNEMRFYFAEFMRCCR